MEKTLQQQYVLIKEGKGSKDDFLKSARRIFPDYIAPTTDFKTAVHILKNKSILNEGVGGIVTQNPQQPDWFKIFDTNLKEAVGVKDTKEYGNQNSFDKIDKEVEAALSHQFDNKDTKNIDNVYGQSFLMGYYTEMKDPKNEGKTVDELKQIVLKNMTKDINYYHTEASFGVKGIGYKKDVVGGGEPKAPKGKYKSSGYGDLKENQSTRSVGPMVKPEGFQVGDKVKYKGMNHEVTRIVDDRIYIKNLKYGGRPDTWVKAADLKKSIKENKPGTQKQYNQEIDWIKYEVDYVPDNKEVYEKWPEPYKSKALKALEYRKRNFRNMSKDKLDSLKENKDTDLKIYQSELNMLNKIKPTGEKQLKRKKELEDKIASLQTNESKLRSLIHNLILEELNEAKRPAVSTEIKEIEKTNEALALEAKIKSIDEAIEKRQAKLNLAESEELAEMIDKNMVKTLQKEIKELEKYKTKASKMYEKMTGSAKKEVIDEYENHNEIY